MAKGGATNLERAGAARDESFALKKPTAGPDDHAMRPTITEYIVPQKQAAKRHYGSHQYFTKRAWNVVQAYIKQFTNEGDLVCDPYGGTGVTIIEALALGRRGVYLDISRWATFLADQIAATPVDLAALQAAFERVEKECGAKISRWGKLPQALVDQIPITRWYPRGYPLPRNADVPTVEDLFTHRQLLCLSELYYHIAAIKEDAPRQLLKYAFSATLYMCNRTFISTTGRKESRGGSSIFSIYRYKVAARVVELDVLDVFRKRFASLVRAKLETNKVIGQWEGGSNRASFLYGYAQNLTE